MDLDQVCFSFCSFPFPFSLLLFIQILQKNPSAALFWASTETRSQIDSNFFVIPNENCEQSTTSGALPAYTGQTIEIILPQGKSISGFLPFLLLSFPLSDPSIPRHELL